MRLTTGFPSMVPLSFCLYYLTIAATAFPPNCFIPYFADIFGSMTIGAIFVNECISSFESCSVIYIFLDLYVFSSKYIINWSIPAPEFSFLEKFQHSWILHQLSIMGTYLLSNWFPKWFTLLLGSSQHIPLHFSMWLIHQYFRFLILVLILVILLLYR